MMTEGIYENMAMTDYLADPCPTPSISTGVVTSIFDRSPLHASREHPRIGSRPGGYNTRSELGSAIHAMMFGGPKVEFVGEVTRRAGKDKGEKFIAEDWKTQDARDARDAIRAAGNIPMLSKDAPILDAICGSIAKHLPTFSPSIDLSNGKCEQTILWQEDGVWLRGRSDWLSESLNIDLDLKTAENAEPGKWIRSVMKPQGYDVQLALRARGIEKIWGRRPLSIDLVVEIEPPFACSMVSLDPTLEAVANQKIDYAIKAWRRGLSEGRWAGYPPVIHYATASAWEQMAIDDKGIQ